MPKHALAMKPIEYPQAPVAAPANEPSLFQLDSAIDHIAHWLPTQGPIKDFIHHNTLHAVQDQPFHEGVAIAANVFGAYSYLPLADYQARYRQGRIHDFAIDWAIAQAESNPAKQSLLRAELFKADPEVHYPPESLTSHGIRERWLAHIQVNLNTLVHPVLFRLLANFLDQGVSRWSIAKEEESLWDCVWRLVENSAVPLYPFREPAARDIINHSPDEAILACLQEIVGAEQLYEQYLLEMLLAHPGWSGMVRLIEQNPQALLAKRQISLKALIAVELACELAFLHKKRGADFLPAAQQPHLFKTLRLADATAKQEVPQRLRVWHEAMEYSMHAELLQALQTQHRQPQEEPLKTRRPAVQALFCIDDRECSLRRHLEEIHSSIETFGAAGFFGIDFLYKGLDDAYPVAQCPVVITPKHLVLESPIKPDSAKPKATRQKLHFAPHSLMKSWVFTQTLGLGYAARLAWDVFRPGAELPKMQQFSQVEAHTHLHLLRESDEPTEDGRLLGFSHQEMADRIEDLLRNIGLTQHFAPLVVVVAHGSSSTNNPHFAAYDCGACAGKPGAPNARAFAWMANDATVRRLLDDKGIHIPPTTRFIAALHNTSRDEITYFDPHLLEQQPAPGLEFFQSAMTEALERNAHERCRWFELGPETHKKSISHQHVKARSTSIFEPRPELNHSNNLYCIVGRRALTRNLFLDRRAFLHSYAPDSDSQGNTLARILSAIIPVCGGINLEYLFSRVDNSAYGAGTKLPHNVIGLLGVANGVEGDLRTGLPSQMIEVHEPARLLVVIEQSPEIIELALQRLGGLREWVDNEWVRLASHHPDSGENRFLARQGWESVAVPADFATPAAADSQAIYQGKTETIPVHVLIKRPV